MKRMLIALAMAPLLMAFSCGGGQRVVKIPTPIACAPETLPAEPEHVSNKLTGNAERDIGIIAGSAIRLRSWGRELHAIVSGCQHHPQSSNN